MEAGIRLDIKEKGMIVVSGCPRSGTSMMMRILQSVFGPDRILGHEFPQEEKKKEKQRDFSEIQKYIIKKRKEKRNDGAAMKRAKDMNPNGYFEMAFTVRGVSYHPAHEDLLDEILADEKPRICKIVSQGLAMSDPRFVHKVVYMVRDPRAVAKSQERLTRDNPMSPESAPEVNGERVLIRSVGMFNNVSFAASTWLSKHPMIPVMVVNYDELLNFPASILTELKSFLGEGDFSMAHNLIDTSLRRSEPEEIEGPAGELAMDLYASLNSGKWDEVVTKVEAKVKAQQANPPAPQNWFCPRIDSSTNVEICKLCKTHVPTCENIIKNAERKKIDWRVEPCPYECGIDGSEGISVEASIKGNHWAALTVSRQGSQ